MDDIPLPSNIFLNTEFGLCRGDLCTGTGKLCTSLDRKIDPPSGNLKDLLWEI